MDFENQVQAYKAWVNSQLKKRSLHINDLSADLKDGTALINVLEIVSGQTLETLEVEKNPDNKRKNIQNVLNFMSSNGIRLQHISVEDILHGRTKSSMQLILALAAHFKPASIGSRRSSVDSLSSSNSQTRVHPNTYRRKHKIRHKIENDQFTNSMRAEIEEEVAELKKTVEHLQKALLEEIDGQPLDEKLNLAEENSLLQARLDQSCINVEKLKKELCDSRLECHKARSDLTVINSRCTKQERELLSLRQQILRHDLLHDKLKTDKAEMTLQVEKLCDEKERLILKFREKERELDQCARTTELLKNDHSRAMSRKEQEINQLKFPLTTSDVQVSPLTEVFNGNTPPPRMSSSVSTPPILLSPRAQISLSTSPKITRRSPLSKNHPSRRKRQPDAVETRVLYFIDQEMTPAITSVAKGVGDITLAELKKATRRENGNFRFIFKALDPELGTVKEEIFNDEDVVPGWEGKIVAWIEEVPARRF